MYPETIPKGSATPWVGWAFLELFSSKEPHKVNVAQGHTVQKIKFPVLSKTWANNHDVPGCS